MRDETDPNSSLGHAVFRVISHVVWLYLRFPFRRGLKEIPRDPRPAPRPIRPAKYCVRLHRRRMQPTAHRMQLNRRIVAGIPGRAPRNLRPACTRTRRWPPSQPRRRPSAALACSLLALTDYQERAHSSAGGSSGTGSQYDGLSTTLVSM
jgi:hypothetical protein